MNNEPALREALNRIRNKLKCKGEYCCSQHMILERIFEDWEPEPSQSYLQSLCGDFIVCLDREEKGIGVGDLTWESVLRPIKVWETVQRVLGDWRPTLTEEIAKRCRAIYEAEPLLVESALEEHIYEQAVEMIFGVNIQDVIIHEGEVAFPVSLHRQILSDLDTGAWIDFCRPKPGNAVQCMRRSAKRSPGQFILSVASVHSFFLRVGRGKEGTPEAYQLAMSYPDIVRKAIGGDSGSRRLMNYRLREEDIEQMGKALDAKDRTTRNHKLKSVKPSVAKLLAYYWGPLSLWEKRDGGEVRKVLQDYKILDYVVRDTSASGNVKSKKEISNELARAIKTARLMNQRC